VNIPISRRAVLASAPFAASSIFGQMATRGIRPQQRPEPSHRPYGARFTDIGSAAGLHHPVIYGGIDRNTYILEAIGCGIGLLDYDNDGWLDILVLCGSRLDGSPPSATNRLYHNNRDGTFTDVTEGAGLTRTGWATGVTIGDYNNDGHEDIFITYWGENVLYRNNGDGTFADVTRQAGLLHHGRHWGTGCTFIDYNRDGFLDLFVSNYAVFDPARVPPAGRDPGCNFKGVPINCGPRGLPVDVCALYRNNGDGTFTDVSAVSGIAKAEGSYGLTAVAADFNGDGWPDIYVACDSTPSLLFLNHHDGTFVESGTESGLALNEDGKEQAGMGVAIGDFNLDGRLDILKTNFLDDTVNLYAGRGNANFVDVTRSSGLGVETRYVSWGAGMTDFDNDGWPDLFWVTGSVFPELESTLPEYRARSPRVLFRNLGNGRFEELLTEAGSAIAQAHSSRGCAFGDFDNDGDVDIAIINLNEPPSLLRNDVSGMNHWLKVRLIGVKSNRSAIGARVYCIYGGRKQVQEVCAQSSFLSVNDRRLHFGLGPSTSASLEIAWPSGVRQMFSKVTADQLVTINEAHGIMDTTTIRK
jgi:hypothetical protein